MLARIAVALAFALTACATPPLRVASDLANPPFALLTDDGEPAGRDVEMTEELARRTGRVVTWVRMPFDRLLEAVENGEVDVAVATLGKTPARAERVLFTRTYYATSIVAVVKEREGAPEDLPDLAGELVAAGRGTTSEVAVRERLPSARLDEPTEKGDAPLARLLAGEIAAWIMDEPVARDLVRQHAGVLRILPTQLAAEDYAIAVSPRAAALQADLDRALAEMEADGTLAALDQKHGL